MWDREQNPQPMVGGGLLGWPRTKLSSDMEQSRVFGVEAPLGSAVTAVGSHPVTPGLVQVIKPCRD